MRVFAISDLHLSEANHKPMSVFGDDWHDHWDKIRENWLAKIHEDDIVLIGGDISWAMTLDEARLDLQSIAELPGTQILLKGNHDYWWSSISRVRAVLSNNQRALQNDCVKIGNLCIAGTRGWIGPGYPEYKAADEKIYKRECARLELSLTSAEQMMETGDHLILLMHYPPFSDRKETTELVRIIEQARPACVVFGHIHTPSRAKWLEGTYNGISYIMSACDYLHFDPIEIKL